MDFLNVKGIRYKFGRMITLIRSGDRTVQLRWLFTIVLLFGVLWETGPITAVVLLLITLRGEVNDWLVASKQAEQG